jgi:integrase
LDRYQKEITPRKAPNTQSWDGHKAGALKAGPIAKIALTRLTGRDVASHIQWREQHGIGAHSILGELGLLSNLFTVARTAWGMSYLVNPVPLAKMARPRTPAGRERRLKGDEETKLLKAASSELAAVIRFALATAMRRGEIAALRWDQVDLKRRSLTLGSAVTKNRTARSVPLSPAALQVLKKLPRRIHGTVFGMTPNALKKAWQRVLKKTGIEDLHFHDLRHEAISRLFEDTDLDLMEIRAISGHKTLQMLARYTHLRTHRLADRLAGAGRVAKSA